MENLYNSADEAAIAWANSVMPGSVGDDIEIAGLIYEQTFTLSNGSTITGYGYTGAVHGTAHSTKLPSSSIAPEGSTVVAYIHTHAKNTPTGKDYMFSPADKIAAGNTNVPLYMVYDSLSILDGILMVYDPSVTTAGYSGTQVAVIIKVN